MQTFKKKYAVSVLAAQVRWLLLAALLFFSASQLLADDPEAVDPNVSTLEKELARHHAPPPRESHVNYLPVLVVILVAMLGLRKLMPRITSLVNKRVTPSLPVPPAAAAILAEDQSFSEFAASFRAAPDGSSAAEFPLDSNPRGATKNSSHTLDPALKEFFASAAKDISLARNFLSAIVRASDEAGRQKLLVDLSRQIGSLKRKSSLPAVLPVRQLAFAFEGLLNQLTQKPSNVTPSALRTLTGAVEVLAALCVPGLKPGLATDPPVRFLAVDDDPIGRRALSATLEKVLQKPDVAESGETALALATQTVYDVIFLDVQMPGMDGFEVCSRIHDTTPNAVTPVVFVTGHADFDSRAKSTRVGGHELIAKPFLTFEVILKALTLVLDTRMQQCVAAVPQCTEIKEEPAETQDAPLASARASQETSAPLSDAPTRSDTPTLRHSDTPAPAEPGPDDFASGFFAQAPAQLEAVRNELLSLSQTTDEEERKDLLGGLYIQIHSLSSGAERAELHSVFRLSAALQALLNKLLEQPKYCTVSALETATAALDLLDELCRTKLNPDLAQPPIRLLVVDDDPIARRAISGALQLALEKPDSAESGEAALILAAEKPFDMIFLDVLMPGLDGFATCARIHETVPNSKTPVVFVTGHSDMDSRDQATISGGSGFIPKPVLPAEIRVTALTFCVRARLEQLKPVPAFEPATA